MVGKKKKRGFSQGGGEGSEERTSFRTSGGEGGGEKGMVRTGVPAVTSSATCDAMRDRALPTVVAVSGVIRFHG